MNHDEILRQFSPEMTPESVGDSFLSTLPKSFPSNPQATLDLHGEWEHNVQEKIEDFLATSRRNSLLFVRIITGQGKESELGFSVLRCEANRVLRNTYGVRKYIPYAGFYDVFLAYDF